MHLAAAPPLQRRRLLLRGQVQGVGMRPFVCRLAEELALAGWVGNTPDGVIVEAEGPAEALRRFEQRLRQDLPPQARIVECVAASVPAGGAEAGFRIVHSRTAGSAEPCAPPDLAPCPDCLRELADAADRRYRYPFLSCSHCGPRYSILSALPFDRERTAMADFALCPACREEYANPADRRFHAQTTCCPECGPQLALWNAEGQTLAEGDAALRLAVQRLREGAILALKGVGGFQLLADAGNRAAVERLRERKRRPHKPFALLADWAMAEELCQVSEQEMALLREPAAPIVLLQCGQPPRFALPPTPSHRPSSVRALSRGESDSAPYRASPLTRGAGGVSSGDDSQAIAPQVAPNLPWLGIMLPASPLHHLLLADFGAPLVATSGNRGGEPICIDEAEALGRLGGIADLFLVHDRPILRPLDDSVVRIAGGKPLTLRRARGYAPTPVNLAEAVPLLLAVGGHLKNTVALGLGRQAVLSQHLGDLDDALTQQQCRTTLEELPRLFGARPQAVACDGHPDYAGGRLAEASGLPLIRVPHHYAHAMACMAEHGLKPPALAIAWDGIGLGEDGALWGGEFLRMEPQGYRRVASFMPLRLPGGEKAVKEPRRVALAALYELYGDQRVVAKTEANTPPPTALCNTFSASELHALLAMLDKGVNTPPCSSVGRLFDAVAALLGLCQVNSFEGQAAMLLEAAAMSCVAPAMHAGPSAKAPPEACPEPRRRGGTTNALPAFPLLDDSEKLPRFDWRPWLQALLERLATTAADNGAISRTAYAFHAGLADAALAAAQRERQQTVLLCGGCFQNRLLLELCEARLRHAGFDVYWPQRVPPNDGGLALGQLWAAHLAVPSSVQGEGAAAASGF